MQSDDENQYPIIEKVVPRHKLGNSDGASEGNESDVDERELEQLLGQTKRPAMKMYADELEEQERARKWVGFLLWLIFYALYMNMEMSKYEESLSTDRAQLFKVNDVLS